jgi:hypothetical protein
MDGFCAQQFVAGFKILPSHTSNFDELSEAIPGITLKVA